MYIYSIDIKINKINKKKKMFNAWKDSNEQLLLYLKTVSAK